MFDHIRLRLASFAASCTLKNLTYVQLINVILQQWTNQKSPKAGQALQAFVYSSKLPWQYGLVLNLVHFRAQTELQRYYLGPIHVKSIGT